MFARDIAEPRGDELPLFANAQAWLGPDMARRGDWIHEFKGEEIAEIDQAVSQVEAAGLEILDVDRSKFPLPLLSKVLDAAKEATLHGRGFHLFRGIPVERYTMRQSAIAYWGLGQHLGEPVSQNGKGHVLGHVANLGLNYADPEVRGYQTSARLPYHSDLSDIVACCVCAPPAPAGCRRS